MALVLDAITSGTTNSTTDVAANATITIPSGPWYQPTSLYVIWQTSADAGNRVPKFTITDAAANVVCDVVTTLNLAASLVGVYSIGPLMPASAAFISVGTNRYANFALPPITLGPGWVITPSDTAAIAASADTVTMFLAYNALNRVII